MITSNSQVQHDFLSSVPFFFPSPGNNTCFYGKCYYCRESEPACAEGEMMEGSLTLWLPDVWPLQKHRHPWGRTYREGKLARWVLRGSFVVFSFIRSGKILAFRASQHLPQCPKTGQLHHRHRVLNFPTQMSIYLINWLIVFDVYQKEMETSLTLSISSSFAWVAF